MCNTLITVTLMVVIALNRQPVYRVVKFAIGSHVHLLICDIEQVVGPIPITYCQTLLPSKTMGL